MKRLWIACISLLLLGAVLVGCTEGMGEVPSSTVDDPLQQEPVGGYEFTYRSFGDGNCEITGITVSPHAKNLSVVIPETSPDGDTVVAYNIPIDNVAFQSVPRMMRYEDFQAYIQQPLEMLVEKEQITEFECKRLLACYREQSLANAITQKIRDRILREYPIAEYTDLMVLDLNLSAGDADLFSYIATLLYEHLDFTYEQHCQAVQSLITLGETHGIKTGLSIPVNSEAIVSMDFPDSVGYVGDFSCSGMMNLKRASLPASITEIPEGLFAGCASLKEITIPNQVNVIEKEAFYGCTELSEIHIPDCVRQVSPSAFDGCSQLVEIEKDVCYVDRWAIELADRTSRDSVEIRPGTVGICEGFFASQKNLRTILIPDSIGVIGTHAFDGCEALSYYETDEALFLGNPDNPYLVLMQIKDPGITSIKIAEETKIIYDRAFYNCRSLTDIPLHEGIVFIGDQAFARCTGLTSLVIPKGIKHIGNLAFEGVSTITVQYMDTMDRWNTVISRSWRSGVTEVFCLECQPE